MNNIIEFNKKQDLVEILKKIKNEFLKSKNEAIKDNISNYTILVNDYEKINKCLKNGYLPKDKLSLFYEKMVSVMSKETDKGNKLYALLLYYNIFKNYGINILKLSDNDISLCIDTLLNFIDEVHITKLEKSLNFVFNDTVFLKLKNIFSEDKSLLCNMIDIVDLYLDSPNFSSSYHALFLIEESKIAYENNLYIINVENICKKVEENAFILASLIDEKDNNKVNYLINEASMLKYKLNNLNEEDKRKCCFYIEELFENNISLEKKLNMIYDKVNTLYNNVKKR